MQRGRVDAIAHSAFFRRSVIKHVTEVGIAGLGSYFCACVADFEIGSFLNFFLINRFGEGWPPASGVILVL